MGDPGEAEAAVSLSERAWQLLERRSGACVKTQPYTAFASSKRMPLR
jgi:hypothetical protein